MELLGQDEISIIDRNKNIDEFISNYSEKIYGFINSIKTSIHKKLNKNEFREIDYLDKVSQIFCLISENGDLLLEKTEFVLFNLEIGEIKLEKIIERLEELVEKITNEIKIKNQTNQDYKNGEIILQLLKNIGVTDKIMGKYIEKKLNSELLLSGTDKSILKYLLSVDNGEITFNDHINPVVKNIISTNAEGVFNYILNNGEDHSNIWNLIHFSPNYLSMPDDINCLAYSIENNIFSDENEKEKLALKLKGLLFDNIDTFVKTFNYPDLFEDYFLKYLKDQGIMKYYILSKLVFYQKGKMGASYDKILSDLYNNGEITKEELVHYLNKNPNNVIGEELVLTYLGL